jgi:hypothetical protein
MNPASIFSYDQSNPFEGKEESKFAPIESPKGRKTTGGIFHNNSADKKKKPEAMIPRQLDGTIHLNDK